MHSAEDLLFVSLLTIEDLLLHLLLLGSQLARHLLHDGLDACQNLVGIAASAAVCQACKLLSE